MPTVFSQTKPTPLLAVESLDLRELARLPSTVVEVTQSQLVGPGLSTRGLIPVLLTLLSHSPALQPAVSRSRLARP